MQQQVSPVVVVVVVIVVLAIAIGLWYFTYGKKKGKIGEQTGGSEPYMQKVKSGQPMYTPPVGAPVPGGGGVGQPAVPPGGGR